MTSTETATTSTAITTATATSSLFTSIPIPAGTHLSQISVDEATNVYAIDSTSGKILIYGGVEWGQFPSPFAFASISVSQKGTQIWALSQEVEGGSNVWRFDEKSGAWHHPSKTPLVLKGISVGGDNLVWGWDQHSIFRWNVRSSDFNKVKKPEEWEEKTQFISLSVGADGTVMGVDSNKRANNVWRWIGGGWLRVDTPSNFQKVIVVDTNLIVGADSEGYVFIHAQKYGFSLWFAIDYDDYTLQAVSPRIIWGTKDNAVLQRDASTGRISEKLKERKKRFVLMHTGRRRKASEFAPASLPSSGPAPMSTVNGPSTTYAITQVACATPTDVWVILSTNALYYYNGASWTAAPSAVSGGGTLSSFAWISVAKDGSVWALGTTSKIYYLNSSFQWVYVPASGISITGISVGNHNEVWVWKPGSSLNVYRFDPYSSTFIQITGPSGSYLSVISVGDDGTVIGYDNTTPTNSFWRWSGGMWEQVSNPLDPSGNPYNITGCFCGSKYVVYCVANSNPYFWYCYYFGGNFYDEWITIIGGVYEYPDVCDGAVVWGIYTSNTTQLRCDPTWSEMSTYL